MKDAAGWFIVLVLLTWAFFAAACLAHAVYHFKAAQLLKRQEFGPYPGPVGRPPMPPAEPRPGSGWTMRG